MGWRAGDRQGPDTAVSGADAQPGQRGRRTGRGQQPPAAFRADRCRGVRPAGRRWSARCCAPPARHGRARSRCCSARNPTPTPTRSGRLTRSECCWPIRHGGARWDSRSSTTIRPWFPAKHTSTGSARTFPPKTSGIPITASPQSAPASCCRPISPWTASACDYLNRHRVALDPTTPTDGLIRLTRRGIALNPRTRAVLAHTVAGRLEPGGRLPKPGGGRRPRTRRRP